MQIKISLRAHPFGSLMNPLKGARKIIPSDRHASNLDAFRRFYKMGRGVEAGADTGGTQTRLDHGASRPLPIGASHMDETGSAGSPKACKRAVMRSRLSFAVRT